MRHVSTCSLLSSVSLFSPKLLYILASMCKQRRCGVVSLISLVSCFLAVRHLAFRSDLAPSVVSASYIFTTMAVLIIVHSLLVGDRYRVPVRPVAKQSTVYCSLSWHGRMAIQARRKQFDIGPANLFLSFPPFPLPFSPRIWCMLILILSTSLKRA